MNIKTLKLLSIFDFIISRLDILYVSQKYSSNHVIKNNI